MYEKLKADVEFLDGNYVTAADMYLEGARDGESVAAFNYGYCLWRGYGRAYDPKEAKSYFSFADRFEMVKRATENMDNVSVYPTGEYLISSATFLNTG